MHTSMFASSRNKFVYCSSMDIQTKDELLEQISLAVEQVIYIYIFNVILTFDGLQRNKKKDSKLVALKHNLKFSLTKGFWIYIYIYIYLKSSKLFIILFVVVFNFYALAITTNQLLSTGPALKCVLHNDLFLM